MSTVPDIHVLLTASSPDAVYVAAREVVAAHKARPYDGTRVGRAVKKLEAALVKAERWADNAVMPDLPGARS